MTMDSDTKTMRASVNIINALETTKRPPQHDTYRREDKYRSMDDSKATNSRLRDRVEYDRKRDEKQRHKTKRVYDEEDEDDNLSFIVDDDEVDDIDPHSRQEMQKLLGKKRYYYNDNYSEESDMEAGYDEIDREERIAAKIANKEDEEERLRTLQIEAEERRRRKMKKMRNN